MKVWVVTYRDYDYGYLLGVYATEEAAKAAIAAEYEDDTNHDLQGSYSIINTTVEE